ncbi:hypothetical protein D3C72_1819220 [compost metagenome]
MFLSDVQGAHCVADSGVVEHHIDHTETCFSRIESGFDTGTVSDIESNDQRLATEPSNILSELLQALNATCANHHTRACLTRDPGQVRTDSAGGTRDQYGCSGQREY